MGHLLTEPQLRRFENLLSNYKPNQTVMQQFQDSNFAVIAGPAGAGKDTLRNALLERQPKTYIRILSTTTRPQRPGEQEEIDYCFRSPTEVESGLKSREFFQTALVHNQQVACMHVDEIRKLAGDQVGLSILIVQTEAELHKLKPDIKTIFLIPPSLEILQQRMQAKRALDPDEIKRRLEAAKKELEFALACSDYYCLVSDDLNRLTKRTDEFLRYTRRDEAADTKAREIIQSILNALSI
jgi:guanylate kinase